ncbi:MAG: sulfatase-like hydrolase/transferase [Sorangiineae bacterium]|nr:sulfatase-like hydrolase/transferase [Polyangiaceae bacterium]MEB2320903.1 sulfatase-like hydrolase/transferase [Sorangiineae bacterium]
MASSETSSDPSRPSGSARLPGRGTSDDLAESGARAVLVLASALVAETVVRTALRAAAFPDVTTALLEVLGRAGRELALAPALVLADLLVTLLARVAPLQRRLVPVVKRLAAGFRDPAVLARATIAFGLATVLFARTLARGYQLVWPVGALFALSVLGVWVPAEVLVARLRRRALSSSRWVGALWVLGLASLCSWVVAAFDVPWVAPIAGLTALLAVVRAVWSRPHLPRAAWVLVVVLLPAGLGVDSSRGALRRFASAHAPFGELGARALRKAADLDGDGDSALFGLDCDDLDPTRAPTLVDLPDDGVDQNCTGHDGSLAVALRELRARGERAPAAPAPDAPPPVVLITVDGLRADVFRDGVTFPKTLAWASRCVRFENAYSNANSTGQSLLALHTGMSPRHVLRDDEWEVALADPAHGRLSIPPTLASLLDAHGWATYVAFPPFHVDNFSFLTGYELGGTLPDSSDAFWPSIDETLGRARTAWREAGGRPLHFRAHLMDLHAPYRGGEGKAGYLATGRSIDERLTRFLSGLPPESIVVLTADHGEAFGEHGAYNHGATLFQEEVRVPLVLCAPARYGLGAPRVVDAPVGLVDVLPTLTELLGIAVDYPLHGQSLVPYLRRGTALRRPWVFTESWGPWGRSQALVLGCRKRIQDFTRGWQAEFDVCADPVETRDLLGPGEPGLGELLGRVVDSDLDAYRSWRFGRVVTVAP